MFVPTLVQIVTLFAATGLAGYVLEDDYFADDFFRQFTFWSDADPTHGFVDYQSFEGANAAGLFGGGNATAPAKMMVDSTNISPQGRKSVRITSNKSYSFGLVIADFEHMPASTCGTWPAFWMVGPNWPHGGEIDILEGVNNQRGNDVTLHTGPGCTISDSGGFSGSLKSTTCASEYGNNMGCQIASTDESSYGDGFNAGQGGVYAMEWTSSDISVWFFPRSSIPEDAQTNSDHAPDPSGWGTPLAHFAGDCDMATAFVDQQIVFDTTFCGDWAGADWANSCAATTQSTCEDYVRDNPSAFAESYWSINGLRVYQDNGEPAPPASTYIAASTSVVYVTQAVASTSVAPPPTATTLVVVTSASAPYVPVVGASGDVADGSSPAETATWNGYAPVIGGDGTVGKSVAESAAPRGSWGTNSDGSASYGGWKREEEGGLVAEPANVERSVQHAKHLRFHKRGGDRF